MDSLRHYSKQLEYLNTYYFKFKCKYENDYWDRIIKNEFKSFIDNTLLVTIVTYEYIVKTLLRAHLDVPCPADSRGRSLVSD